MALGFGVITYHIIQRQNLSASAVTQSQFLFTSFKKVSNTWQKMVVVKNSSALTVNIRRAPQCSSGNG